MFVSPAVVVFVITGVYLLLGGMPPSPESSDSLPSLIGLAITVVFTGATGEELDWRGFALPRLQGRFNALTSSLLFGCWWGVWRVPLRLIENDVPSLGYMGSFMIEVIAQSVIITWLCNNTGGSVLMTSLNHYAVNISIGLVFTVLGLTTWDVLSMMSSLSYSIIAVILLFLYGPRRLMRVQ